jgi:ABC-type dipeptide/oligopeptide/nickel transport system permease component
MARYIVVRLTHGFLIVLLVTVVTFSILHLAPGDPVLLMVGEAQMTAEQLEVIRRHWGLDQPVHIQYLTWLGNLLRGDFGQSVGFRGKSVGELLWAAVPNTAVLNLLSLGLAVAVAIPAGVLAAVKRASWADTTLMFLSTLGVAVPNFWLGLMLIVLFSLTLKLLPPFGQDDWRSYILPVVVLATAEMALLARLTRSATLEVLGMEYVLTARAKGLSEATVLTGHVLRNALLPIVTVVGYRVGFLLSGTIVVETIFAWPGVGRLLFQAVSRRDYPVVQGVVLMTAAVVVLANLITDLIYAYIDPRIRYDR